MTRRVGAVDIGTNSTRLLVADVSEAGGIAEVERLLEITRLGDRVDADHHLGDAAMGRVHAALERYAARAAQLGAEPVLATATSAVRDAENGGEFLAGVAARHGFATRLLSGDEEAELTYRGVCSRERVGDGTLICDIGGGSTELVLGSGDEVSFFASLQVGTVRHSERYLAHDPPSPDELEALADDVRDAIDSALTGEAISRASHGIAVAGTPTSLAAIDQELDPYDPERVHGYVLELAAIQRMCSSLATKPLAERIAVKGLHPHRAPTIVAGVVILIQAMRAFGLARIEVSEHDILWGAALDAAGQPAPAP
jgi:exopolyphosphatase/guanosine-5'-triphosphate,3'-diphosphate pyrophosphatase